MCPLSLVLRLPVGDRRCALLVTFPRVLSSHEGGCPALRACLRTGLLGVYVRASPLDTLPASGLGAGGKAFPAFPPPRLWGSSSRRCRAVASNHHRPLLSLSKDNRFPSSFILTYSIFLCRFADDGIYLNLSVVFDAIPMRKKACRYGFNL